MHRNENPATFRFRPYGTLLAAALGLASLGQAAAETRAAPDARVAAASSLDHGVASAWQPGRERMERRFDRRPAIGERRARRDDGWSGPAGRRFGRRMAAALELTEEQRDQMREAMRDIGDNRRNGRRQVADARRALQRAARDPEQSAEEIRTLGEALGRAQADLALQRRSGREQIAAILPEDQRERLEQLRERRGSRARGGRRG